MIRILHVLGTLNTGGAESRIMDLYRHIDRSKVQFDFLVHHQTSKGTIASELLMAERPKGDFDDEVRALGGRIYALPRFTGSNMGTYRRAAKRFFKEHHEFAAVEGHMTSLAAIYLPIAKKAGVPVTIAHARSAGVDAGIRGLATKWFRRGLAGKCDYMLSCSTEASSAVFGKRAFKKGLVQVVPNAIEIRAFRFDAEKRHAERLRLGLEDEDFVIGHVGRFDRMKNQQYIADLAGVLQKKRRESGRKGKIVCVFAGKGEYESQVRRAFAAKGLADNAIFAGQCDKKRTIALYQAFDCFVFPSLYEGLPGTVVEAQAAGLPCIISDTITKDVSVTELVKRLPLKNQALWIEKIQEEIPAGTMVARRFGNLSQSEENRVEASAWSQHDLAAAGFDVEAAAKKLQRWYEHLAMAPTVYSKI